MLNTTTHPTNRILLSGARCDGYDAVWFEALFAAMDRLHDQVSDPGAAPVLPLEPADMVGWLEDIIYTAQEAIVEIRDRFPETGVTPQEHSAC